MSKHQEIDWKELSNCFSQSDDYQKMADNGGLTSMQLYHYSLRYLFLDLVSYESHFHINSKQLTKLIQLQIAKLFTFVII